MNKSSPFPLSFIVPINPIPKQSYRHGRGGGHQPKGIKDAEFLTGLAANKAMEGEPAEECILLEVTFYRKDHVRCDIDNLVKLFNDSLNGIVWKDDSQIVELRARKSYDKENPRTEVTVDILT